MQEGTWGVAVTKVTQVLLTDGDDRTCTSLPTRPLLHVPLGQPAEVDRVSVVVTTASCAGQCSRCRLPSCTACFGTKWGRREVPRMD